jgi:hypothetical protein
MGDRKHRLVDCNPEFRSYDGREGALDALVFDCPEGHRDCRIHVPFTPALDGSAQPVKQRNGAQWSRTGDAFETLTLSPSVRTIQQYPSKEAALAAGVGDEWFAERMICGLHIFVRDGAIEFCGDSR